METPGKKVLLTSNGDEISENIAFHLAKRGCRLSLILRPLICMMYIIFICVRLVSEKIVEKEKRNEFFREFIYLFFKLAPFVTN
jgi:hypothetical protein